MSPLQRACGRDIQKAASTTTWTGFSGTWTEEADAFDEALREQRKVDPGMWR